MKAALACVSRSLVNGLRASTRVWLGCWIKLSKTVASNYICQNLKFDGLTNTRFILQVVVHFRTLELYSKKVSHSLWTPSTHNHMST